MASDTSTRIRRGARRTCSTDAERIRRTAKRTKPSDLELVAEWVAKRKLEVDAERKTFDTQYEADISRGQWLAFDELLTKYLQPKLERLRRAAK